MQFQSDVLGVEIARPELVETTALGAAFLAGLGTGVWKDQDQVTQDVARAAPVQADRRSRHGRRAPRALGRRGREGVIRCLWCPGELARAGKLLRCTCGAAWVDEPTLASLLAELDLVWTPRTGDARACLDCDRPMEVVWLEGIALDRCALHGVWFDPSELALVLHHAEHATADEPIPESARDGAHAATAVATEDAVMLTDPASRADYDDTFLVGHERERFQPRRRQFLAALGRALRDA